MSLSALSLQIYKKYNWYCRIPLQYLFCWSSNAVSCRFSYRSCHAIDKEKKQLISINDSMLAYVCYHPYANIPYSRKYWLSFNLTILTPNREKKKCLAKLKFGRCTLDHYQHCTCGIKECCHSLLLEVHVLEQSRELHLSWVYKFARNNRYCIQ